MNTIREIEKINEEELKRGIAGTSASWHAQYQNAPWVYVGNLDHELTEGDIICVMSQFGEIEDIHLVREEDTGKSKGFGFVKYEDSRSCILAVDNFSGVKLSGRPMRVDHVEKYRLPKQVQEKEEAEEAEEKALPSHGPGHAYKDKELANEYNLEQGHDLFAPPPPPKVVKSSSKEQSSSIGNEKEEKLKRKEERNKLRQEKEERKIEREKKRLEKDERKRKRRAKHMRDSHGVNDGNADDDDEEDNDRSKDERKHRKRRKHHEEDKKRRKRRSRRRSHSRSLSPTASDRSR